MRGNWGAAIAHAGAVDQRLLHMDAAISPEAQGHKSIIATPGRHMRGALVVAAFVEGCAGENHRAGIEIDNLESGSVCESSEEAA